MNQQIRKKLWFALAALCLLALGCNQPFDPRAPFQQKMVVFSVLSTDRDIQFVRVDLDYMPPGFDPLSYTSDNAVADAAVRISQSNNIYELRDTLLARPDTLRYDFPIRAFYLSPFTPQYGTTYNVRIESPSLGIASSSVVVPEKPIMSVPALTYGVLYQPFGHMQDEAAVFDVRLSSTVGGFVGRLYIDYDVLKGSTWVSERAEVPISSADPINYSLDQPVYPHDLTAYPHGGGVRVPFKDGYIREIIRSLTVKRYAANKLTYKWVTFVLLQADPNLYRYYRTAHGFQDPRSTRLDEPSYSNIDGGVGLFGAYTLDSLVVMLPENFGGNR